MDEPIAAGLLLTGGASRRMGFDKTLLRIDGTPLAARLASVMRLVLDPVIEVGPGRSGLPSVREAPPGSGPLAALAAGHFALGTRGAGSRPVVVVAGDHPFVTAPLLSMLVRWPADGPVVPVVGGRAQPLLARWSAAALASAAGHLAAGHRSLRPLLERHDVEFVPESRFPHGVSVDAFHDVDTPEDLERLGLSS